MLIVRGTKKLRDRVKGPQASGDDASSTLLGDWFATALFWRPQVALLVNERTMIPVFVPLAPAKTLLDRIPAAIGSALRVHGVDEPSVAAEVDEMHDVRVAPTNNRSIVGVMNEFAFLGEHHQVAEPTDLMSLSVRLAGTPLGPLRDRSGFPEDELAAAVGGLAPPAKVIPIHGGAKLEAPSAPTSAVYQLKVTLRDTKPPIWRRVLVDSACTLDHLHEVVQAALGWWNYHLHEFQIDGAYYGVPDPDEDWGPPPRDERETRLDSVASVGSSFDYTYDFGDNWRHKITVENVLPADSTSTVPACTGGRRACPPEDCGGTWGYRDLVKILADPTHPEHAARTEWIGHPFDPDAFDADEFEQNLRSQQLTSFDG